MQLTIPKKPRIKLKQQAPDQRTITVCPIRAATDRKLTPMELRALLVLCSYTNKAGVTWVGNDRIGKDLGVSGSRAQKLTKSLADKGYTRTIHKGFRGVCADSRQVIFNAEISADEAAAITGELAPFQVEKQRKEVEAMQAKEAKKRRKARAKQSTIADDMSGVVSDSGDEVMQLAHDDMHRLKQIYGADIIALALAETGSDAPIDAIESAADRLLR